MAINYIFTITAGRSGQATLHNIIEKYALNCISAFESPSIESIYLPGFLGNIEKRIRRKTERKGKIETEEKKRTRIRRKKKGNS